MNLMKENQRIADERKILELQFAKSTGEEREQIAQRLLGVRKQVRVCGGRGGVCVRACVSLLA